MKKSLNFLFVLAIIIAFSVSCTKSDSDVFKLIPEKALAVVSFHPGQLLEKSKSSEIKVLKEELSGNDLSKKLMENPESSGIELDSYSTFFFLPGENPCLCFIMPVKSMEDFETTLKDIETESDITLESGKIKGYKTKSLDHNAILAYNKKFAIIAAEINNWNNANLNTVIEDIIKLPKDEVITTDKDFKNFLGKQKDINLWVSTNNIEELPKSGNLEMLNMMGGVKNNYSHLFLDFQNGYMSLSSNFRPNASWKETLEKYNFLNENASKEMLKYIPSQNLLIAGNTNMDPEKMIDLISWVSKDFRKAIDQIEMKTNMDINNLKTMFTGEVAFGLLDIKATTKSDSLKLENFPSIIFAGKLKNKKAFDEMLETIKSQEGLIEKDGYYSFVDALPLDLAIKNNDLILSNNHELIREIADNGKTSENVTKAPYSDLLSTDPVCFFVNFNWDSLSEEMQNHIYNRSSGADAENVKTFMKGIKSVTFRGDIEESEFRIDLVDNSENSLYLLLSQIDKLTL